MARLAMMKLQSMFPRLFYWVMAITSKKLRRLTNYISVIGLGVSQHYKNNIKRYTVTKQESEVVDLHRRRKLP
jgi:hypothetical protein